MWVALPLRPHRGLKQKSADEAGAASDQPHDRLVAHMEEGLERRDKPAWR